MVGYRVCVRDGCRVSDAEVVVVRTKKPKPPRRQWSTKRRHVHQVVGHLPVPKRGDRGLMVPHGLG